MQDFHRGGGAVGKSIRLASGKFGVRIPAATDLIRKIKGSDKSIVKRLAIGMSVTGPRR